jgi:Tfp pilus assembly PilM family ATPase
MAFRSSMGKASSVVALDFGPSTLRFVEMMPEGNPKNQVLSAGVVILEAGDDASTHADRIRSVLRRTVAFRAGPQGGTLIASVPLRHAFLRLTEVPEETEDVPAALRWDMAQYLARPLDWYALDFLPQGDAEASHAQRYLAAAYRHSEVETLLAALADAGAPAPVALDIDALATLDAFAANYPECLPERTVIVKADAEATLLFRTRNGEYLGGLVQRESPDVPFHAMEAHERAEHLLHRARMITLALGGAAGAPHNGSAEWTEPERIFLCGDLSGDADFRELLKTGMQAPFALLNPFRKVSGPDPDAYPVAYPGAPFAAAVGLALRACDLQAGAARPRLNLLRHLPAPEREPGPPPRRKVRAPKPLKPRGDRRPAAKRLWIAFGLLVAAVLAGLAIRNPAWVQGRIAFDAIRFGPPKAPEVDSVRLALENEASRIVSAQQRSAIAWLTELETAILPDSAGIRISRAAFTSPDGFVLQGLAKNSEAMSRFQESLVLVPGIDLRRSESRPAGRAFEFLFSGGFLAPEKNGADSTEVPNLVTSRDSLAETLNRFLRAAADAGFVFESLAAPAPTSAETFEARPFRLRSALGQPGASDASGRLRAFLEHEYWKGSPFGIQRISLENAADSQTVFLDIMAFCR